MCAYAAALASKEAALRKFARLTQIPYDVVAGKAPAAPLAPPPGLPPQAVPPQNPPSQGVAASGVGGAGGPRMHPSRMARLQGRPGIAGGLGLAPAASGGVALAAPGGQRVTVTVHVPDAVSLGVIGRKGETIGLIRQTSGAEIKVAEREEVVDGMRWIRITASSRHEAEQAVLMVYNSAIEYGAAHGVKLSMPARDANGFVGPVLV
ncbi:uncharacterized protein AMSG_08078 [Thecamonas trahens ATCC 50062]|uniref:K Homology domain-containing protein n=1 Tax=Thecamonas trahens ATCC 50062 TaxID=461836 RepID=A0A0L0DM90_THETB|nr:hypothetical protein AMSG_08078 [Thecamonas trahens ATCC 50062]KNC52513.1 hypothetical protein AMSG_08078 [Thecamonas trahens ATCC 50062]|eukprot:XP_013755307.1 hypothetical protein AMSG_08078 [Thecamonas trahens ATCC 50062]